MINLLKGINLGKENKEEEVKQFVSDKEEDKKSSSLNEVNKQIQEHKKIGSLLSNALKSSKEVENEVALILHIKRTVRETGRDYNDKSEIIYINARMKENTDLGRLMHDFHCTKAEDMYSKVLAERVRVLKETQEGVEIMCKEMDKIYKAGELIGEERGKEKGKYETAMKLLELGAREDMIAEAVGHSVEEIKRWKNDMKH